MSSRESVTELLQAHRDGVPGAFDRLVEIVYPELRDVARRQLRRGRRDGPLLDTTGLVHEAYLKLVDQARAASITGGVSWAIVTRMWRWL